MGLGRSFADALFVIAAAALLLVFIGIHNAWDTVTYVMARGGIREPAAELGADRAAAQRAGAETETAPGDRVP